MDFTVKLCNNDNMSKNILLELTEQEAEVMVNAIAKERSFWESEQNKEVSGLLKEKILNICDRVSNKIDRASEPQQDVLITAQDLFNIVSKAKDGYNDLRGDLQIS